MSVLLVSLAGCEQQDSSLRSRIRVLEAQLAQKDQEIERLVRKHGKCREDVVAVTRKLVRAKVERDKLYQACSVSRHNQKPAP